MKLPLIVAFIGPKQSGKSTAAELLVQEYGYKKLAFASPLKNMLAALGLTPAQLDGDQKEVSTPLLGGKTPRHAMQTLGTEWGRELIHPHLWEFAWRTQAQALLSAGERVVVDDCRFANEHKAIKDLESSVVIETVRPTYVYSEDHASEQGTGMTPDFMVMNSSSEQTFRRAVHNTMLLTHNWKGG